MDNPFLLPCRDPGNPRPLSPWEQGCQEHEHYYAPVDHTEEQFKQFKETMNAADITATGRVVLVCGNEGCGKSALINRSAYWLQRHLAESRSVRATILDLTTDRLAGVESTKQVSHIGGRILDTVEIEDLFDERDQEKLSKRRDDPFAALPFLSTLLARSQKALLLLLPQLELPDELRSYVDFARPNIVLFCESSYDEVVRYADRAHGPGSSKPVTRLEVVLLKVPDGWIFIQSRLRLMEERNRQYLPIDEETARRFMETRIRGRGRTTIRELQLTCTGVFASAMERGASSVGYTDFLEHYLRKGVLQ
jgi:energy-coupling factor transporter ATP-binding protein EcfA2